MVFSSMVEMAAGRWASGSSLRWISISRHATEWLTAQLVPPLKKRVMSTVGCERRKGPWKSDNGHLSPPYFLLFFFAKLKSSVTDITYPLFSCVYQFLFFTRDILFYKGTVMSRPFRVSCRRRAAASCKHQYTYRWIFIVTPIVTSWYMQLRWNLLL